MRWLNIHFCAHFLNFIWLKEKDEKKCSTIVLILLIRQIVLHCPLVSGINSGIVYNRKKVCICVFLDILDSFWRDI